MILYKSIELRFGLKKVSKMTANVQEFFRAITKIKTKQILISTLISLLWKKTINFTIF